METSRLGPGGALVHDHAEAGSKQETEHVPIPRLQMVERIAPSWDRIWKPKNAEQHHAPVRYHSYHSCHESKVFKYLLLVVYIFLYSI